MESNVRSNRDSCMCPNPWMARYVYGLIFLLTNLLAWGIRDYGQSTFPDIDRLKECRGGSYCFGTEGVLRVSLGCFIFYFTMFLSTAGATKLNECRDSWHSGWWSAKILLWIALLILPFFVPPVFIQLYGTISYFGTGVFLLIQLISVISSITWLKDYFQSGKYAGRCHILVILLSMAAYAACIVGIILMYIQYAPVLSCLLNIFFITCTLVLLLLITCVSLLPNVNASFLTAGLMGLYVVFICWCAIRSEPPTDVCRKKAEAAARADWLTIIAFLQKTWIFWLPAVVGASCTGTAPFIFSFIIALLAMAIAIFTTVIDSTSLQFRKVKRSTQDIVPYGYGVFHFVFATGTMYFAMLLIGWNAHHTVRKWTIDVGWISTWVRIVIEWLSACVYSKYLTIYQTMMKFPHK